MWCGVARRDIASREGRRAVHPQGTIPRSASRVALKSPSRGISQPCMVPCCLATVRYDVMLHAAAAAYAARAFLRPKTHVTSRDPSCVVTHCTVLHDMALRGVVLRFTRLQHLRAKSLIPNGPFRAPNFMLRFRAYRAAPNVVARHGVVWRGTTLRCASAVCVVCAARAK